MKDKVFNFVTCALGLTSIGSGLAAFIIALGVAGRDEMLSEIGKAASYNPLPGLALAFGLFVLAAVTGFLAMTLIGGEDEE